MPLGHWSNAADGRQQWQWQIHSPGAASHLLVFRSAMLCSMWDHELMQAAWTCHDVALRLRMAPS